MNNLRAVHRENSAFLKAVHNCVRSEAFFENLAELTDEIRAFKIEITFANMTPKTSLVSALQQLKNSNIKRLCKMCRMRRQDEDLDIEAKAVIYKLQGGFAGEAIDDKKSPNSLLFRPLKPRLLPNKVRIIRISYEFITAKPIFKCNAFCLRLCSALKGVTVEMPYLIHRDLGVREAAL